MIHSTFQHSRVRLKAPAKWSQHLNATYPNIVGRNMLRAFGHPVATCCDMLGIEYRTSAHAQEQHCCTKPGHDYNFKQHPRTVHEKFDHFQIWANDTQHVATYCNTSLNIPNTLRPTMLRYVASPGCVEMLRLFGRGLYSNSCSQFISFKWLIRNFWFAQS